MESRLDERTHDAQPFLRAHTNINTSRRALMKPSHPSADENSPIASVEMVIGDLVMTGIVVVHIVRRIGEDHPRLIITHEFDV